jgi:hypothetical protein
LWHVQLAKVKTFRLNSIESVPHRFPRVLSRIIPLGHIVLTQKRPRNGVVHGVRQTDTQQNYVTAHLTR